MLNPDYRDILSAFGDSQIEYLIVGGRSDAMNSCVGRIPVFAGLLFVVLLLVLLPARIVYAQADDVIVFTDGQSISAVSTDGTDLGTFVSNLNYMGQDYNIASISLSGKYGKMLWEGYYHDGAVRFGKMFMSDLDFFDIQMVYDNYIGNIELDAEGNAYFCSLEGFHVMDVHDPDTRSIISAGRCRYLALDLHDRLAFVHAQIAFAGNYIWSLDLEGDEPVRTPLFGGSVPFLKDLEVDTANDQLYWLADENRIMRGNYDGSDFEPFFVSQDGGIGAIALRAGGNEIYFTLDGVIYKCDLTCDGEGDLEFVYGIPDVDITDISIVDHNLLPTASEKEFAPEEKGIITNYPNPFSRTTTLTFWLARPEHAKVEVIDVAGRTVAVLVNEVRSAGNHQVLFDASHLPSGVYFYRFQSGNQVIARPMVHVQ